MEARLARLGRQPGKRSSSRRAIVFQINITVRLYEQAGWSGWRDLASERRDLASEKRDLAYWDENFFMQAGYIPMLRAQMFCSFIPVPNS